MKLLLIMADARIHRLKIGPFACSFREAPLTLTTLAAMIPKELNIETELLDESVQRIDFVKYHDFDLVGISAITGTSLRAYDIADYFRSKSIPVVMGGVHVTIFPDEAQKHADFIIAGFAEKTWPEFLKDFKEKKAKKRYVSAIDKMYLEDIPIPRRDLQKKFGYMMPNTVMATRGCKNSCDFCTVPVICKGYHKRPIPDIIRDIRTIKAKRFTFNDVSITEDPEYAKALFKEMIPLKKNWGGLSTFHVSKDKEMMELLEKSGCKYLLTGIESVSQKTLRNIYKGFNKVDEYEEGMKKFHDAGILIQGCFIFGFDHDRDSVFEETVEQVNRLKVDIPRFAIYTPYPGTILFKRLEKEKRILTYDWSMYDTQHVVYRPEHMSQRRLYEGFRWAYKETFKLRSIFERTLRAGKDFPITFLGNLAYKLYVKKLKQR
jgi:radical SAM superfamily enzyme YgiQ (UPF0313 family)